MTLEQQIHVLQLWKEENLLLSQTVRAAEQLQALLHSQKTAKSWLVKLQNVKQFQTMKTQFRQLKEKWEQTTKSKSQQLERNILHKKFQQ